MSSLEKANMMQSRSAELGLHRGRYTVRKWAYHGPRHLPMLFWEGAGLWPGLFGRHRIDAATRVAFHLHVAHEIGCPVCIRLFPLLAPVAGLSPAAVRDALDGAPDHLSPAQYAAIRWADQILAQCGEMPTEPVEQAQSLSAIQRRHLHLMMRFEHLMHSPLVILPASWIEAARKA